MESIALLLKFSLAKDYKSRSDSVLGRDEFVFRGGPGGIGYCLVSTLDSECLFCKGNKLDWLESDEISSLRARIESKVLRLRLLLTE